MRGGRAVRRLDVADDRAGILDCTWRVAREEESGDHCRVRKRADDFGVDIARGDDFGEGNAFPLEVCPGSVFGDAGGFGSVTCLPSRKERSPSNRV